MQKGSHHTPEARAKLSRAAKGRVFTAAHRAKIAAAARRREAERKEWKRVWDEQHGG